MMAVTRKVKSEDFTTQRPQLHVTKIKNNMDIEQLTENFSEELIEKGAKPEELIEAATCLLEKVIQLQKAKHEEDVQAEKPIHLTMVKTEE